MIQLYSELIFPAICQVHTATGSPQLSTRSKHTSKTEELVGIPQTHPIDMHAQHHTSYCNMQLIFKYDDFYVSFLFYHYDHQHHRHNHFLVYKN